MLPHPRPHLLSTFEAHRPELLSLAYRMLGDLGRAEDMVHEAWLCWERTDAEVESPKAFLITVVTRLCLSELASARARREESRSDRLPEPGDLEDAGIARVERLEEVSMAFLVMLQRLAPSERAVLLLHDVFDFEHKEIAELVGMSVPASRKALERAREHVASGRRMLTASDAEHRRLLSAFLEAAVAGDVDALLACLASDAVLIGDGGEGRRATGRHPALDRPIEGAESIAAFFLTLARAG